METDGALFRQYVYPNVYTHTQNPSLVIIKDRFSRWIHAEKTKFLFLISQHKRKSASAFHKNLEFQFIFLYFFFLFKIRMWGFFFFFFLRFWSLFLNYLKDSQNTDDPLSINLANIFVSLILFRVQVQFFSSSNI